MSLHRGIDGSDPVRSEPIARTAGPEEQRRMTRTWVMATGTLACPHCDAPVAPTGPLGPGDPLACPFCAHAGPTRDFLTLGDPVRPARVTVRVIAPGTGARARS